MISTLAEIGLMLAETKTLLAKLQAEALAEEDLDAADELAAALGGVMEAAGIDPTPDLTGLLDGLI